MTWPTAAVLGVGAEQLARKALRAAPRAHRHLVIWDGHLAEAGIEPEGAAAGAPGGSPPSAVMRVPRGEGSAMQVLDLLAACPGAVAVAIPGERDDEVDRVLPAIDEVLAVALDDANYRTALQRELAPLARRLTILDPPRSPWWASLSGAGGQATVALLAIVAGAMAVAVALGLVASALGRTADVQGRADVAALAGAAALRDAQARLYDADPARRITVADARRRTLAAARRTAQANDLDIRGIRFEGSDELPTRLRVSAVVAGARRGDRGRVVRASAEVAVGAGLPVAPGAGEYRGPFAVRQGQRMRPDVAMAFDRMQAAATRAGRPLAITSAFRSDAEQAALFAAHPDPKWVAPPGKSLHRLGTELDLGPKGSWGWLAANAQRYGFTKRYSWEEWHFGYTGAPGSASVGYRAPSGSGGERATSAMPSFVPDRYAPLIIRASQRWSVGAALLAAQLWQESKFNPRAVSPVGAAGIAQFMPGTAAQYGLSPQERFDPAKAIDAQAHLMHDLLRQFASVPLALAAYNAGPGNVSRCMCVPNFPETQGYVQSILALLGGAGLAAPAGLEIRLVV
jgi:Transglycosylase SLT domain/D-alanyl-D-alanine carboxypeptidase